MKNQSARWVFPVCLCLGGLAVAQEPRPPAAAVEGIKGVKEDAVANVKRIETGNAAASGGIVTGTKSDAQGVNKVNGVETISGVQADGRTVLPPTNPVAPPPPPPPSGVVQPATTVVAPPPPPPPPSGVIQPAPSVAAPPPPPASVVQPATSVAPPPPPPIVSAGGTAVPAGGGSVGSAANIRAVQGVAGIDTAKLQNLEKALVLKQGGGDTPTGAGAEKGGKGKSAAAALLAVPLEKKPGPKQDGRDGFQEFEKLQNNGS